MTEKYPNMKTNCIILDNGIYGCPKCKNTEFKHYAHSDGIGVFTNHYRCEECDTVIYFKVDYGGSIFDITFKNINDNETL